jgi:hypothetical protein
VSAADRIAWDIAVIIVLVAASGVLGWLVRDHWCELVMRWQTRHDGGGRTEWTDDGPVTVDYRPPRRTMQQEAQGGTTPVSE